jgi:penicillin-binding protein 1A
VRRLKIGLALLFVCGVAVIGAAAAVWTRELNKAAALIPQLPALMERINTVPTRIVSADGQTLFTLAAEHRKPVAIDEVPQHVIDATLAAEDRRFFDHSGIDGRAIVRQIFTNVREGRVAGGASTLTMQLAKRLYSASERTLDRKIQDMALAVMMERELTKDQILELYLNQVFFGSGAYGIGAAAQVYFGKDLDELTIAEAALLARCVRRPSQENPFANLERATANRNVVLGVMLEEGMITPEQHAQARAEPVRLARRAVPGSSAAKRAPYFVDYVLDQVRDLVPGADLSAGGYTIETTLDMRMQRVAERELAEVVRRYRGRRVTTGAFLLMDREGQVKAMAGGVDYRRNQFNALTQGRRQPGSAFKTFVYAAALEMGRITPWDSVSNARFVRTDPVTGRTWAPQNASDRYGGDVSVRTALAMSLNMPAIRVMEKLGPRSFVTFAGPVFGFESEMDAYLPLALGASALRPVEMAEGYSVFMLGGDRARPYGVRRVLAPDGAVLFEARPKIARRVLSRSASDAVDGFLRAVVTSGTGRRAASVVNARGKTGTTSDNRDAWFVGYTDRLLGVGWVANEVRRGGSWRYEPMAGVFGGTVTIQMWTSIMRESQRMIGERQREIAPPPEPRRAPPAPVYVAPPTGQEDLPVTGDAVPPPDDQQPEPTGAAAEAGAAEGAGAGAAADEASAGGIQPLTGSSPHGGPAGG